MGHETKVSTKIIADRVCLANNEKILGDAPTINSVEKVFLIRHATTQEDETKEEQSNSSSPKTIANETKDTKCKFCEAIKSLHLQDESGNNFEFKTGQRKHYLEAGHKNIIQFPEHCGYFMKLSVQDKKQVLKNLELCQVCATRHSDHGKHFTTNTPCQKYGRKEEPPM